MKKPLGTLWMHLVESVALSADLAGSFDLEFAWASVLAGEEDPWCHTDSKHEFN